MYIKPLSTRLSSPPLSSEPAAPAAAARGSALGAGLWPPQPAPPRATPALTPPRPVRHPCALPPKPQLDDCFSGRSSGRSNWTTLLVDGVDVPMIWMIDMPLPQPHNCLPIGSAHVPPSCIVACNPKTRRTRRETSRTPVAGSTSITKPTSCRSPSTLCVTATTPKLPTHLQRGRSAIAYGRMQP